MANLTDSFHLDLEKIIEKIPNVSLDYDTENKEITLKDWDTVISTIDATDFIKDGMVDSAKLEDNNLIITFNTDAGKEEIEIDLSKFINAYTSGDAIDIKDDNSVNVKFDNDSIVLNDNGELSVNDIFHVEVLPENPEVWTTVQLIWEDYDGYKKWHIYRYIKNEGTPPKIYKSFIYNGNRIWTLDWQEFYCLSLDNPNYELNSEELNNELNLFNIRLELEGGVGHDSAISACEDLKASFIETNGEGPITMNIGGSLITFNRDEQKDFIAEEGTESEEPRWIDIYNPEAVIDTFHVETLPENPEEGMTVQLVGEDYDGYKKGHIYKYSSEEPETYKAYMSEAILYHKNWDSKLYGIIPDWDHEPTEEEIKEIIRIENLKELTLITNWYVKWYNLILNDDGSLKDYCFHYEDRENFCASSMFESEWWASLEDSRLPQFDITTWWDSSLKWIDIYGTSTPISYTEWEAIEIKNDSINVKYDDETIKLNDEWELSVNDEFHVTKLPENPNSGDTYQLIEDDGDYKKGHIYQYHNEEVQRKVYKNYTTGEASLYVYNNTVYVAMDSKVEHFITPTSESDFITLQDSWSPATLKSVNDETLVIHFEGEDTVLTRDSANDFIVGGSTNSGWVDIYSGDTPIVEDIFHVETLPENPTEWDTVQLIGEDYDSYEKGHIYKYSSEEPITYKAYMSEWVLYHHNWDKILYLYRPREWDFDESGNFNPSGITFDMLITLDKIQGLNSYTVELNPDGSLKSYCVDMLDFWNSCIENDFESMWWTSLEDGRRPQYDITVWWDDTLKWRDVYGSSTSIVEDTFNVDELPDANEYEERYALRKDGKIYINEKNNPVAGYVEYLGDAELFDWMMHTSGYCYIDDLGNAYLSNNSYHDEHYTELTFAKASSVDELEQAGVVIKRLLGSTDSWETTVNEDRTILTVDSIGVMTSSFIINLTKSDKEKNWTELSWIQLEEGDGIKIRDNIISNPYKPQIVTQEQYDALTDKTGFYLIRS